jgi:CarD family transcriptional regulator
MRKGFSSEKKVYYVLHPLEDSRLKISVPVDSQKVTMLDLIHGDEAEEILEGFRLPGMSWIEIATQRNQIYSSIVKTGNRKEIAMIVNTLKRKKREDENKGKKLHKQDDKLLTLAQNVLFTELALSLGKTFEKLDEMVSGMIKENYKGC